MDTGAALYHHDDAVREMLNFVEKKTAPCRTSLI